MAFVAVAAVGVAISAYGTVTQMEASKKAAKASRAAADAQRKQEEVAQQRERLKQVREARQQAAIALQAGTNQGAGDSSAIAGGVGSIKTQAGSNLAYINSQTALGNDLYNQNVTIRTANRESQTAQGWSNFGSAVTSVGATGMSGGFNKSTYIPKSAA